MGDAGAGAREHADLGVVQRAAMGVPDMGSSPAGLFYILARPHSEFFETVGDVLGVLGQVRVQTNLQPSGHVGGVAHQFAADRERRTRSQRHARHRCARSVVIAGDHPLAVLEDDVGLLDHAVRRQAALAFTDAHRPAGRGEPHADLTRRLNLVVKLRAVGEHIEMIARRGATRKRQLGQPHQSRNPDVLRPHARPNRIKRFQPAEQQLVLPGRNHTG